MQILLLLLHPFLANMSGATTSNALLAKRIIPFVSSCCNNVQNRSQYVSLNVACIKEVYCFFLKNKISTCTPDCQGLLAILETCETWI